MKWVAEWIVLPPSNVAATPDIAVIMMVLDVNEYSTPLQYSFAYALMRLITIDFPPPPCP
jgi:hypothetical protein